MKRLLILTFCICALILFGCADPKENGDSPITSIEPASDAPVARQRSFDYRYGAVGAFGSSTYITETDDTIFYLCDGILYFSDKDYKDFLPLCARPDCSHSSSDCDAHIDSISGIWIYGDCIYYAVDNDPGMEMKSVSLCRMRIDGSRHEELLKLDPVDMGFTPQYCQWQFSFHDSFANVSYSAIKNPALNEMATAWGTIDLDDIRLPEYELNLNAKANTDEEYYRGIWLFEDDNLMYELNYVNRSDGTLGCRLTIWDQDTDQYRLAAELAERPDYLSGCFMVYNGCFYYLVGNGESNRLHRVDLNTGVDEIEAECSYEELPISSFDWKYGTFLGYYRSPDGDPSKCAFYAYDTELDLLDSFTCEGLPEEVAKIAVFLQTDSYLFAAPMVSMNQQEEGEVTDPDTQDELGFSCAFAVPSWYIDKSEIGTGNLTWRRWAPDGE